MPDGMFQEILKDGVWDFVPQRFYRGPYEKEIKKHYKISICTTCMGRVVDIERTFLQNIKSNLGYYNDKMEFVLLNYNSRDGLDDWAREMLPYFIDAGIVNYYHTFEPQFYSMTHSRNIAFKLAQGDIVNNVDADHFTNKGFVEYINLLANQGIRHPVFLKSKQKNRGRLGMFKKEFLWLRGYDEGIEGYGFDDVDLLYRALCAGFSAVFFGGKYFSHTEDHRRHPTENYSHKDWKYQQRKNTLISLLNLKYKKYRANKDVHWGKSKLVKNFTEEIEI
jgi:hypothetical protein